VKPSAPVNETEGRTVLRKAFEAAGLRVVEDFALEVAGKTIHLDGYDPDRKLGYEYLTTEAGDREELTADVLRELDRRIGEGELAVLLVDELDGLDAALLNRAAEGFLDAATKNRKAP